ncbi:FecR family protein [Rhizosphaericola mali]|uniref:FecR family protein n=1 Tax=Rhizosphaericola mali TaxID=2545455 RepID=A0A5P2FZS3_9BACT|nr:FecR family protein [Rhizosphaericola mali]QES89026.1 FecR family protein [Rhizosphaericola mali]
MSIDFNNDAFKARLDELEKKWLAGTISKEEMDEYAKWFNQEQNKKVIVPEDIALSHQEHEEKLLDNILHSIDINKKNNNANTGKSITIIKKYWLYGSAAAVLVIVSLLFFKTYLKKNKSEILQNDFAIAPGKDGMNLLDAHGKIIVMDNLQNHWKSNIDGIAVEKHNSAIIFGKNTLSNVYNTATTTKGQQFQIVLPDGTKIFLNSQSSIKFPISMNDAYRFVELTGEAYFEVHHNEKNPFIVKVNGIEVKDIGTKFNIENYSDDSNSMVTLLEGAIQATSKLQIINLKPTETISWDKRFYLNYVNVDTASVVAWTRKEFSFNNATLKTIAQQLERWYNVDVVISNKIDKNTVFSGGIPMNQNLQEVLKVLSYSGIHYKINDKTIYFLP